MKRLLQFVLLVAVLGGLAQAQFVGYTSAQTTTSVPFSNSTCTAALAAGTVLISNIGQAAHSVTMLPSGGAPTSLAYTIQASYDGATFFDISDYGTYTVNSAGITGLTATGYYPVIGVRVNTCIPGSANVTLKYSGISMTPGVPAGTSQIGQLVKNIATLAAANASLVAPVLRSPFGSSSGTLQFVYTGAAGPAGSTLQVACGANGAFLPGGSELFSLQTTQSLVQIFQVPPSICPFFIVTYTSGGASTATFNLDYTFASPGLAPSAYQFTHVTGTTATAIKATLGYVHTVSVNTGAVGTFSVFDLPLASCTGTPATNTVAVITSVAATLQTFVFDVNLLNGICVKASAAMDVTVSSQ